MFALDISDHSIEALELSSGKRVKAFGRIILPENIIKDGEILDKDKLAKQIKRVVLKAKIKSKKVVLSVPESKVFIHVFKDKNNIKDQALKTIPWNPNKIYFDMRDNLYVAVPRNIIDAYIEVLEKAGLKPIGFDVESLALARALKINNSLVIDIGARTTNLSVFEKKEEIKISISIASGGDKFTRAIANKLKVSLKKAEELKIKEGFKQEKIMLVLQKEFQPIIKEARKLINYYKADIRQVVLVGGLAQMPEIVDYFSSNLGLKVIIGKSNLAGQLGGKSILYNTVIGSALKNPSKGINLLPGRTKGVGLFNKVFHYFKKDI